MTATPTLRDAERYIGLEYRPGVFDCASLAVLVQRELFGRTVALPAAGDRSQSRRGQAREIAGQDLARRIDAPTTGCAAVLWESTADGRPPLNRQWHIATVFVHLCTPWLLHAANPTRGIALERMSAVLAHQGMHLDGFYEWT